jgi:glutamate dehydrogenase
LERAGRLDRAVEYLPSEEELRARAKAGEGLSRPEIAVLLSYSKLDLLEDVARAALPDEPFFRPVLEEYFPPAAVARFSGELEHHRLKREIIATQLVNTAVNLAGPLFAYRMREMTSTPHWQAIEAFAIVDAAFGLVDLKARIDALDRKVPSSVQYRMLARIGDFLRRSALWFIVHRQDGAALAEIVAAHGATADILRQELSRLATEIEMRLAEETAETFVAAGVPADIAHDIAVLAVLDGAPDITLLSRLSGAGIAAAGACFSAIGEILGLDLLRTRIDGVVTGEHWDRLALRRAADDLYSAQRVLAREALAHAVLPKNPGPKDGKDAAREWSARHAVEVGRMRDFLSELERSGELTLSKVSLASSRIQKLARASWQN